MSDLLFLNFLGNLLALGNSPSIFVSLTVLCSELAPSASSRPCLGHANDLRPATNTPTRGSAALAGARPQVGGGGGGAAGWSVPGARERAPQRRRVAGRQGYRGKIFGRESLPRENHADLKHPLSGKRCAARASIVWPWGAILDFARWRAGEKWPNSRGLARFDSVTVV